jgi:hypothetical protein
MFTNNVSQTLSPLQKTSIQTAMTSLTGIFSWFMNLTPADRKKLVKMGPKSESFVRGVLQALQQFPAVAGPLDLTEFEKDMTLWDDLVAFSAQLTAFFEGLQDTMFVLASELMQQGNAGYGLIKEAAKTNQSLTQIAADLGERYKKAEVLEPTAFTLAASASRTLNGVVVGRQFKVITGGPVTVYKGAFANGENKIAGVGNSFKISAGWSTITIVSSDPVNPTIFLVAQE